MRSLAILFLAGTALRADPLADWIAAGSKVGERPFPAVVFSATGRRVIPSQPAADAGLAGSAWRGRRPHPCSSQCIDASQLSVRAMIEFQASNRDLYKAKSVVASGKEP